MQNKYQNIAVIFRGQSELGCSLSPLGCAEQDAGTNVALGRGDFKSVCDANSDPFNKS